MSESASGRGLLALPDFLRLWLVGLAVAVARWLEMLIIAIVVFEATGSAFLVAAMSLLRLAPMGLFGAFLGVLADRVPRRRALLAVLAMQAAAVGALAALAAADALGVWHIAVACFAGGLGWAADHPIRRMLIGQAVGGRRMGTAVSLDVMASNASRAVGPALGGVLLASLGPSAAFGLAMLLNLLAIAAAFGLRIGTVAEPARQAGMLQELRDSFGFVLREKRLRAAILVTIVFNLFAWPCSSMVPVVGRTGLALGPDGVGLLASMDGLGALAGAALVGALARPERYAAIYVGGTIVYLVSLIGFALAGSPVAAGALLIGVGVGGACFATMQGTLIYILAPADRRGRALGVLATAIGTGLLGFLMVGAMAEWVGAAGAIILVAGAGLLVLVASWAWWKPMLIFD
jgi:MFS family permease